MPINSYIVEQFGVYLWSRYGNDDCTWKELMPETRQYWVKEAQRAMQFLGYKEP